MPCLRIEKVNSVMRRRQMAVHTVGHKPLCIVHMSRGLPGVKRWLNFMTRGTKLRGGCPNHGVIKYTKQWECDQNARGNEDARNEIFFQNRSLS